MSSDSPGIEVAEDIVPVSVVIVTHNRKDDVLQAIESALAQNYSSLEILVFDDLSKDGTVDEIQSRFPTVRLFTAKEKGSATKWRNLGFSKAKGEIVFSLDDDSYFSDPDIVRDIVRYFEEQPDLAVVGIPFIEPFDTSRHAAEELVPGERIAAFTACAVALRRNAVLQVGGYRELFEYYGEESDIAIRLREAGYDLVQGASGLVVHVRSPRRDTRRQTELAIRNRMYFIWFNYPVHSALYLTLRYWVGSVLYRFKLRDLGLKVTYFVRGSVAVWRHRGNIRPVSSVTRKVYKSLRSHGKQLWSDGAVPAPCRVDRNQG